MSVFDLVGLAGVALVLVGYAATTLGRLHAQGATALAINFIGPSLILLSMVRAFNLSAALVEAAWALIAFSGLMRIALRRLRRRRDDPAILP
jgi:hypothetical protein